jgi:hypothetical protein
MKSVNMLQYCVGDRALWNANIVFYANEIQTAMEPPDREKRDMDVNFHQSEHPIVTAKAGSQAHSQSRRIKGVTINTPP